MHRILMRSTKLEWRSSPASHTFNTLAAAGQLFRFWIMYTTFQYMFSLLTATGISPIANFASANESSNRMRLLEQAMGPVKFLKSTSNSLDRNERVCVEYGDDGDCREASWVRKNCETKFIRRASSVPKKARANQCHAEQDDTYAFLTPHPAMPLAFSGHGTVSWHSGTGYHCISLLTKA
jgi:hypothetical protein